jgi:hypothetical protein
LFRAEVSVETCDRMGRHDATEAETTPDGRLPDAKQAEEHL